MNNRFVKLGIGSVQFGLPYGISNTGGQTPSKEVEKILQLASDSGIKLLDTASSYGESESLLGKYNRSRFAVVSKFIPSQANVKSQLEDSLKKLRVLDIYGYLAHRPDLLTGQDWKELEELKLAGKIKKIGFSLNTPLEGFKLRDAGFVPDLIQVPYNYFDNRFEELLKEFRRGGCEVHTRSAFLQGLFFSKVNELPSFFNLLKPQIKKLQDEFGEELNSALLKYVIEKDFIDIVIIGVEDKIQLEKNLKGLTSAPNLDDLQISFSEELLMPMCWPNS